LVTKSSTVVGGAELSPFKAGGEWGDGDFEFQIDGGRAGMSESGRSPWHYAEKPAYLAANGICLARLLN
jgi:hypothetical protein